MPTAAGSQPSIDDIRKNYRVQAGPFYVDPAILLKELGVDTNVFNQAGDTNADFTMVVAPQAAIAVPFSNRALVKSLVGADLVYYAQYASERSIDPQAAVRAEFDDNARCLGQPIETDAFRFAQAHSPSRIED